MVEFLLVFLYCRITVLTDIIQNTIDGGIKLADVKMRASDDVAPRISFRIFYNIHILL